MRRFFGAAMTIAFMLSLSACNGEQTSLEEVAVSTNPDLTFPTISVIQMLTNGEFKPITKETQVDFPDPYWADDRKIHLRVLAKDPEGLGSVELKITYNFARYDGPEVRDPGATWPECRNRDAETVSTNDLYLFPKDLVKFRFDIKPRDDGTGKMVVATSLGDPFNVVDVMLPFCYKNDDLKRCYPDFKSGCYIGDPMLPQNLSMTLELVVTNRSGGQKSSEKLIAKGPQH